MSVAVKEEHAPRHDDVFPGTTLPNYCFSELLTYATSSSPLTRPRSSGTCPARVEGCGLMEGSESNRLTLSPCGRG